MNCLTLRTANVNTLPSTVSSPTCASDSLRSVDRSIELCTSSCVEGRTQSSARGDLVVQRTRTNFGRRAFVVAGPAAWNRLPCSVRNSPSLDSFKTVSFNFPLLILMLLHALYERLCTAPLNRLPCYGALEVIVTLLLLLLLLYGAI